MWHPGSYLLNQGSNLCPLHWEHEVLTAGPPTKPLNCYHYHYSCACSVTSVMMTFCDPMDSSPMGSSVHGILPARILEWITMPSSRGSSPIKGRTRVSYFSCIVGSFFTYPGSPIIIIYNVVIIILFFWWISYILTFGDFNKGILKMSFQMTKFPVLIDVLLPGRKERKKKKRKLRRVA